MEYGLVTLLKWSFKFHINFTNVFCESVTSEFLSKLAPFQFGDFQACIYKVTYHTFFKSCLFVAANKEYISSMNMQRTVES